MNFVESLDMLGIPAKEIPCLKGKGAPTTATAGAVGVLYMNTSTGDVYKCVSVSGKVYTWKLMDADVAGMQDQIDVLAKEIADMKYVAIDVTAISITPRSPVELGTKVDSVTVAWSLNKEATAQTVDGKAVDPSARSETLTDLGLTAAKTFTVKATDERGATDSAGVTLNFYNGVYYGVMADGAAINSATVRALTKSIQSGKAISFTANAGTSQRIAYALPARYGTPVFNVGGFDGGFYLAATLNFTNASGYTESYNVWLSDNVGLGSTTVKVT